MGDDEARATRTRFLHVRAYRRWGIVALIGGLAAVLIAGVAIVLAPAPRHENRLAPLQNDADVAIQALHDRDLVAVDRILARHRGQSDFAYFFASKATPRALGDALAAVPAASTTSSSNTGLDSYRYELVLTDLAGTLALATHGTGDRTLQTSWTDDFVAATTTAGSLTGKDGDTTGFSTQRAHQDIANRQNLLLLLARGYWSTDFLKTVTKVYWDIDRAGGDNPWLVPGLNGATYAPSPSGTYLTDGIVALAAALTANPAASQWAFTAFQPGEKTIEGTDQTIGTFAHQLFFGHRYGGSAGETDAVGMAAALTALSAAIESTGAGLNVLDALDGSGPAADSIVLQSLATDPDDASGGSIFAKAWNVTKHVSQAVWQWVQKWGHRVLDILTIAPPPFGAAAAGTNAVWYAVEGDYADAGLSLAAAVPTLAFVKIVKKVKAAKTAKVDKLAKAGGSEETTVAKAERKAKQSESIGKAAKSSRVKPWKDCDRAAVPGGVQIKMKEGWSRRQRQAAIEKVKVISAAAENKELQKTEPVKSKTYSQRYKKSGGKLSKSQEVDHIIERQLGGSEELSNLKGLDKSVNRSIGKQIAAQLGPYAYGHPVPAVAICGL